MRVPRFGVTHEGMLARTDRIALAGRVGCDPRTVIAWVNDPQSVKRYLAEKLDEAAKDLEIDLPKPAAAPEG